MDSLLYIQPIIMAGNNLQDRVFSIFPTEFFTRPIYVEIWCLTLYLFRRLRELTLIVPCYFGHSSVNLGYKIAL